MAARIRTLPEDKRRAAQRVLDGVRVATVAKQYNVTVQAVYRWVQHLKNGGDFHPSYKRREKPEAPPPRPAIAIIVPSAPPLSVTPTFFTSTLRSPTKQELMSGKAGGYSSVLNHHNARDI